MTKNNFKDLIEAPINYVKEKPDVSATRNYSGAKKIFFKSLIYRTIRLTLQYPEFAKKYLDSFPKIGGNNIPTPSDE